MPLSEYSGGGKLYKPKLNTMKKLLLTTIVLCAAYVAMAKQPYDLERAQQIIGRANVTSLVIIHEGDRLYFDPDTESYRLKKDFIEKYGRQAIQQIDELESKRLNEEAEAAAAAEREKMKSQAFEMLMDIDSFESVSYHKNGYDDILDVLDGSRDGMVDYLSAALFFRDQIAGIDKNGNISMINVIQAPSLSKDQIYIQTNSWFVNTFNSGKSVIQLNEKDAGVILAKGYLKNIAEQVGFAISYEISASVLFRIDIKDGRARLITTIQEYESVNRGGVAGAISGNVSASMNVCKPETVYPFVDAATVLSRKAGAKAYCACCMYMIAMKNQLEKAINEGIIGGDLEDW